LVWIEARHLAPVPLHALRGLAPPSFDHIRLGLVVHVGDDPEQAGIGAGVAVGIAGWVAVVARWMVPPPEADELAHRLSRVRGLGEAADVAVVDPSAGLAAHRPEQRLDVGAERGVGQA
jgi:hypothetical protein